MENAISLADLVAVLQPLFAAGSLFGLYALLATAIEFVVEKVFAPIFDNIPGAAPYKPIQKIPALALAITAAFALNLNIIADMARQLDFPRIALKAQMGWAGPFFVALTGIIVSMGSGRLHELFQLWGIRNSNAQE